MSGVFWQIQMLFQCRIRSMWLLKGQVQQALLVLEIECFLCLIFRYSFYGGSLNLGLGIEEYI
jgi:hypothetical protein